MKRHTRSDVVKTLTDAGIPVGPVLEPWEAIEQPQVIHNEMIIDVPYSGLGSIPMAGFPIKMSGTPGSISRGAPRLGEQTDEILAEMGYSAEAIASLRENKVV